VAMLAGTRRIIANAAVGQSRNLRTSSPCLEKIVVALYPDPVAGYPPKYARDSIPHIEKYADGQTAPTPSGTDFTPGELLGCVSGELGLRKFLEARGHTLVVTSDKDGDGCEMDKHLHDADVVISQPFYPYYVTRKRMEMAPNLKLALTAGIGSDHVDLQAAMERKIDVAEVTYCNSESVAEHVHDDLGFGAKLHSIAPDGS
jgi:formate dehydrogenase